MGILVLPFVLYYTNAQGAAAGSQENSTVELLDGFELKILGTHSLGPNLMSVVTPGDCAVSGIHEGELRCGLGAAGQSNGESRGTRHNGTDDGGTSTGHAPDEHHPEQFQEPQPSQSLRGGLFTSFSRCHGISADVLYQSLLT